MSPSQVAAGVALTRKNALRLAQDAATLLRGRASRASVYGQWHLAVEELGKSVMLQSYASASSNPNVRIPGQLFRGWHREKFAAGLEQLPNTRNSRLNLSVQVKQNSSAIGTTVSLGDNSTIPIGPYLTGEFRDLTNGSGPAPGHGLRLQLLYVDFDGLAWHDPEGDLGLSEIVAQTTISSGDLELAIKELLAVLKG